jgi:hypothetical protein
MGCQPPKLRFETNMKQIPRGPVLTDNDKKLLALIAGKYLFKGRNY